MNYGEMVIGTMSFFTFLFHTLSLMHTQFKNSIIQYKWIEEVYVIGALVRECICS